MSEHDSWIAVQGMSQDELLERLGLEETGEVGWPFKVGRPYALGMTPAGWPIIYVNFNGLAHIENIRDLSYLGMVVACDFQNQVEGPTALIVAARNGEKLWEIGTVVDELFVTGEPPPEFEPLRDHYVAKIAKNPEYCMYEVPIELGRELCGFRHDQDESQFKGLRPKSGSAWHRNLKRATHPKSLRPPESRTWRQIFDEARPPLLIGLIIIILLMLMDLFAD